MNAKQAARKAQKMAHEAESAKENAKAEKETVEKTDLEEELEFTLEHFFPDHKRAKLPAIYETKYKSELLKAKIADPGMWAFVPSVNYSMESKEGIRRLKENDPLFTFIDTYFPDMIFAFEPNMQDGRFVFLPEHVTQQGTGVCISKKMPGFLEVGHFWYPMEYTEHPLVFPLDQVYVAMFSHKPDPELARMIRNIYAPKPMKPTDQCCIFPFGKDVTVTLGEDFLDRLSESERIIRNALKNQDPMIQRNGEGLIMFMRQITGKK